MDEVVDLFCGAAGTITAIFDAYERKGKQVKVTGINHWKLALETAEANYKGRATFLPYDLDFVKPRDIVPGGYLNLLTASPECTHHSNAAGGRPMSEQSRATAWHVLRWAESLYIENIIIENVPEFKSWGPLNKDGRPVPSKKGELFLALIRSLEALDYTVDYRDLVAADYGDPTTRKRLYIIAKKQGPVIWPEQTHSKTGRRDMFSVTKPWKPARDIIDWSVPGKSIFDRKKPLSENTMRRIIKGLQKFSGLDLEPYLVMLYGTSTVSDIGLPVPTVTAKGQHIALAQPFLIQYHGSSYPGGERVRDLGLPMPTVAASNTHGLIEPYIVAVNHGKDDSRAYSLSEPMRAITTVDAWGLVTADPFVVKYNGTGGAHRLSEPIDTLTSRDRFGLVQPKGIKIPTLDGYIVVDILYRMLLPKELAAAMSFPKGYKFKGTRENVVKQIGNANPIETATNLVESVI